MAAAKTGLDPDIPGIAREIEQTAVSLSADLGLTRPEQVSILLALLWHAHLRAPYGPDCEIGRSQLLDEARIVGRVHASVATQDVHLPDVDQVMQILNVAEPLTVIGHEVRPGWLLHAPAFIIDAVLVFGGEIARWQYRLGGAALALLGQPVRSEVTLPSERDEMIPGSPSHQSAFTPGEPCDWGECSRPAVTLRYDIWDRLWRSVCEHCRLWPGRSWPVPRPGAPGGADVG